jgi:hypothetical protein
MNQKFQLAANSFGMTTYFLGIFFSSAIWMNLLHGPNGLAYINLIILAVTLLITFWPFLNRKKALAYLIGAASRILFLVSICIVSQIGSIEFKKYNYSVNFNWMLWSIGIFVMVVAYQITLTKRVWPEILNGSKRTGKIDIERGYFKIMKELPLVYQTKPTRVVTVVAYFIVIIAALGSFGIIFAKKGGKMEEIMSHFCFVYLGCLCMISLGAKLVWTTELAKLEKKLGITFVTEYGMLKQKGKK